MGENDGLDEVVRTLLGGFDKRLSKIEEWIDGNYDTDLHPAANPLREAIVADLAAEDGPLRSVARDGFASANSRLDDIEEMVEGDRQSTKDQFADVRRQLAELRKLFAGEGPA